MLVLSRKINERLVIGGNVVLTVVRLKSGAVALGFEAPDDVRIVRSELVERPEHRVVESPRAESAPCGSKRERGVRRPLRDRRLCAGR